MRLSGADSPRIAARVLHIADELQPRIATLAELRDEGGGLVDSVLVTYFAAPRSYTAENVVEVSCHGSQVILRYCVERCLREGARLAEPGEFTLRAYLNGRLDLARAEAVRDLINSTSLYQAKVAAQQMEGSVSRRIKPWKEQLLELISLLEAGIDFADNDIDIAPNEELLRRLRPITASLDAMAKSFAFGRFVHDGFSMAIVGRPNAGKSSLFNRLLERDRAIVTDIPGTTRDVVSDSATLNGIPVRLLDTAGIRDSTDVVESLGVERSFQAMVDADLILVVLDSSQPDAAEEAKLIEKANASGRFLIAANKCDLESSTVSEAIPVSALTGQGIEDLRKSIASAVGLSDAQESGFITSLRHERLLKESVEALRTAEAAVGFGIPHEMLLLDLYAALSPIDAITGATTADDILNRIFATFCIGK